MTISGKKMLGRLFSRTFGIYQIIMTVFFILFLVLVGLIILFVVMFSGNEELNIFQTDDCCLNIGEHAFSQMQGDLDQQRLLGERPCNDPVTDILIKEMQHKGR